MGYQAGELNLMNVSVSREAYPMGILIARSINMFYPGEEPRD